MSVGYSAGNSYDYLMDEGLRLQPDLLLLQLWVVDDLCGGRKVTRPAESGPLPPSRVWLERARQSHLAMFIRDRLRSVPAMREKFFACER